MPFSHKVEVSIYMTDCVADLVIVTVTINLRACSHWYISSFYPSRLPQVCRTKEKRNITQRRWSTYKIYKVLHQNQLPRFMRTLICCCSALLFKAPWQCDCPPPPPHSWFFFCALLYKISKVYQTEGRLYERDSASERNKGWRWREDRDRWRGREEGGKSSTSE